MPFPAFPDATAPLSPMESKSQKGPKWNRLYPRKGMTGAPTKQSSACSPGHMHPYHSQNSREASPAWSPRAATRGPAEAEDEVATG